MAVAGSVQSGVLDNKAGQMPFPTQHALWGGGGRDSCPFAMHWALVQPLTSCTGSLTSPLPHIAGLLKNKTLSQNKNSQRLNPTMLHLGTWTVVSL